MLLGKVTTLYLISSSIAHNKLKEGAGGIPHGTGLKDLSTHLPRWFPPQTMRNFFQSTSARPLQLTGFYIIHKHSR